MLHKFKSAIRSLLHANGWDLRRLDANSVGHDAFADMAHFLDGPKPLCPVILDIGANVGQTAEGFLKQFPGCRLHSFEPSPTTFNKLRNRLAAAPNAKLWNAGVGSTAGFLPFHENAQSVMSSFLKPETNTWGETTGETQVPVITVDQFCAENEIDQIDILKSDTQGFDLEVLKGARGLLESGSVSLVYLEVTFADLYKNAPPYYSLLSFLGEREYRLVSIYRPVHEYDLVGWTDMLFIHRGFYRTWAKDRPGWPDRV